jgi:hypothetical protein
MTQQSHLCQVSAKRLMWDNATLSTIVSGYGDAGQLDKVCTHVTSYLYSTPFVCILFSLRILSEREDRIFYMLLHILRCEQPLRKYSGFWRRKCLLFLLLGA